MENNSKQAVITILGLAGGGIHADDRGVKIPFSYNTKQIYYFDTTPEMEMSYVNMLPLLIDRYTDDYHIVPLFTEEAKLVQSLILRETEGKRGFEGLFDDKYRVSDENDFDAILSLLDSTMQEYERVIIDITHGFRHLPILAIINLIMQNIKNHNKIEHIWFAKEIVKASSQTIGKYEIIDLKSYLELANLSFVITNFKDNFTISSSIIVADERYKPLMKAMTQFSRDIMALSLNNLFYKTYPKLDNVLQELESDFLLESDIRNLRKELKIFDRKQSKTYELYLRLADYLIDKEYLLQSVALVSEAKGFYLLELVKGRNDEAKEFIEEIEEKILSGEEKYTYFFLIQDCKKIYGQDKPSASYMRLIKDKHIIKNAKESVPHDKDFNEFIFHDLRNTLAHADLLSNIEDAKSDIGIEIDTLRKFEKMFKKTPKRKNSVCNICTISQIKGDIKC